MEEENINWVELLRREAKKNRERLLIPDYVGQEFCDDVIIVSLDGIRRHFFLYSNAIDHGNMGLRKFTIGIRHYEVHLGQRFKGKKDWISDVDEIEIVTRFIEPNSGYLVLLVIRKDVQRLILGDYYLFLEEERRKNRFLEEKLKHVMEELNNLKETVLRYADLESKVRDSGKDKGAGVSVSVEQPEKGRK